MHSNVGHAKMTPAHPDRVPTRHKCNRNWTYRGDNTKYKEKT